MGATKQIMYNCVYYLKRQEGKEAPLKRWFQHWLKSTKELHTIQTNPILIHRVDIYIEEDLRRQFEEEYRAALLYIGISK